LIIYYIFAINRDRFSKFFHWQIQHKIGNKMQLQIPSHLKRVAALRSEIINAVLYASFAVSRSLAKIMLLEETLRTYGRRQLL